MQIEYNILKNEIEFRNIIFSRCKNIYKLYVYEDYLDQLIFFYCFFDDGLVVATKEKLKNNFSYYYDLYKGLAEKENLFYYEYEKTPTIKLIKK